MPFLLGCALVVALTQMAFPEGRERRFEVVSLFALHWNNHGCIFYCLSEALESVVGKEKTVLKLANVEFVDSAGLGAVVASLKRLRAMNGDMKICNVHKSVRALFELVRMHKLVDIYNTREEALA